MTLCQVYRRVCRIPWTLSQTISCQCNRRCVSSDSNAQGTMGITRRVFSGIQPTGVPHLGNYLGAVQHWVAIQDKFEDVIFSIVDMHSITLPQDPNRLRDNILDMVACLLAVGVNPEKSILFQQSSVSEHAELGWILGCLTTLPRLQHLPQWKEKSEAMTDVPLGIFTYPVLQSADILLYKATDVPVGDDQVKHIELTRHLANKFNKNYGLFFPKPNAIVGKFHRIRSLRNPQNKMSKSEPDPKSRIELTDTPDDIREKCRKAVTDMTSKVTHDPVARPGVSNLVEIYSAVTGASIDEVCGHMAGLDTLQFKMRLADVLIEKLSPIREEVIRLQADKGHLMSVLKDGQDRANNIAHKNFTDVKRLVGLLG